MDILRAVILGAVQGLTELLPVSSSAHLLLVPKFLGWPDFGMVFDTALHLGTLLAIVSFFRKDLWAYFLAFLKTIRTRKVETFDEKMVWYLAVGSIPAVLAGVLLENEVENIFRAPVVTAFTLALGAVLLWVADRKTTKAKSFEKIRLGDGLSVGFAQALALVPGISRSGITITFGMFRGMTREAAAKFSFLLGAPITLGAALFELRKLSFSQLDLAFWSGLLSAAVFGFLAIKFLFRYISRSDYGIFVYYRLVLAVLVLVFLVF